MSSHYQEVPDADIASESMRLRSAWQADELPSRQRKLVDAQLANYRQGIPIDVFDVMVNVLRKLTHGGANTTVLEIGCSSGFYSEVFSIAQLPVEYFGCDYSAAFIQLAQATYPQLRFDIEDATEMSYSDEMFDVVISGCCLLHIPEYEKAIAETARVVRDYVVFHRTPVVVGRPNKYFRKKAYGVETVEIHFGEADFLKSLRKYGLELIETHTLSEERDPEDSLCINANRTYVCRKLKR
ncbi:class I SAM-dependent methyltransferase [Dechloromonas denitrificans]|uniref:class I SAM-dependent methyltransferase n=1 Tax=Dechloromonas denitrificans TaxID=281362 RepID=UPI001CF86E38|nr:class I SAM-dependent methyltransferase [Dechloromonas denitrificans]UCV02374.1 class I SAM-dependent methyltransferase [Dechloromonas denitrificans]